MNFNITPAFIPFSWHHREGQRVKKYRCTTALRVCIVCVPYSSYETWGGEATHILYGFCHRVVWKTRLGDRIFTALRVLQQLE